MDVYAIGSDVLLDGMLTARVVTVQIRGGDQVLYEVVWWNGQDRKSEWVEAWEIICDNEETRKTRVNQVL